MSDDMDDDLNIDDAMEFGSDSGFVTAEPPAAPAMRAGSSGSEDAAGMDQVRGILLGPLAEELQTKMIQLSQRLDGSMLELDRRTADRVSELEARSKDGMDALVAELAELKDELSTVLQQVREELEGGTAALTERIERLSKQLADDTAGEIKAIRKELEQLSGSITSRLDCEAAVLRSELVDRDSLSAALSEVAMRLSGPSEMIVADVNSPEMDLEAAIEAAARNS